jgi:hypothetical protein
MVARGLLIKMKRFTATEKWDDVWFRKLTPRAKCLWMYICDKCDHAGVIDLDVGLASFQIGDQISDSDIESFNGRVRQINDSKLLVSDFIRFQYGKLSRECKPHMPVFAALSKHGIPIEEVEQNKSYTETVPGDLRAKIIKRDGLVCAYTGKALTIEAAVVDHVIPRSKGGRAVPENLVVCCREVNAAKCDFSVDELCRRLELDVSVVNQELINRTSKPLEAYQKPFQRVQEEEERKDKEQKGVQGDYSILNNEEFIARLKFDFSDRDVDGEIRRLKQLADKEGTALSRNRVVAWLKKASPAVTPPRNKSPKFDRLRDKDPIGWLEWVGKTYGTECAAYRNRIPYCDAAKDVQEQFRLENPL